MFDVPTLLALIRLALLNNFPKTDAPESSSNRKTHNKPRIQRWKKTTGRRLNLRGRN